MENYVTEQALHLNILTDMISNKSNKKKVLFLIHTILSNTLSPKLFKSIF